MGYAFKKGTSCMRIAIDTHFITSGKATGNRTYTIELIQAMIALQTSHEFILYIIEDDPFYHQYHDNPRVKIRNVLSSNGFIRNFISIPKALAQDKPDVVHLLFIRPFFANVPTVLTVHDLFYVQQKDISFYQKMIGKLTLWSATRSDKIITISEYSRQDILKICKIDRSVVKSIPLGIDKRFFQNTNCSTTMNKYGIKDAYILFVGRTEDPRKNLMTLIDAYAELKSKLKLTHQLVIAGRHGQGTQLLIDKVKEYGLSKDVVFPGIIAENDLPSLLSGAKLFVYVSAFEGFGLPVLEAMACGVPVITSNTTSLPEVAGDAAIQITPGDKTALSKSILKVLNDPVLQETLRQKGLLQSKKFSWDLTARCTINIYEDAILSFREMNHPTASSGVSE
jgi:glycosyltransferase involved in cell wall biosynthesis